MKTLNYSILATALALGTLSAGAQLKKEIVVEREIEPAERAATRPADITPGIYSPKIERQRLNMTEYDGKGEVSKQMTVLSAARWRDTLEVSPYRGYIAGGYFPAFNAGLSAGYRLIKHPQRMLDAWLQYNGFSYKQKAGAALDNIGIPGDKKTTLKQHQFAVGLDFANNFSGKGVLDANLRVMIANYSHPAVYETPDQTASAGHIDIEWTAATEKTPWHLGADFGFFGFDKKIPAEIAYMADRDALKAANEKTFGIRGGIGRNFGPSKWSIDVDARFQALNTTGQFGLVALEYPTLKAAPEFATGGSLTQGVTRLTPRYSFAPSNIRLNLGVNVDIATGGEDTGVSVSPAVEASWAPSQQFAISARVDGGRQLNTLADIYDYTPYTYGSMTYGRSKIPFDARISLDFGSFKGFTASLFGGYAKADDWYTPSICGGAVFMHPGTVKGFRYGLQAGYSHRYFDIRLAAEGTPNSLGHGYYKWRDNARWNFSAGVEIRPIDRLTVNLNWKLRTGRYATHLTPVSDGYVIAWDKTKYDLGDANDLSIGARYAITEAFSAFADVENLLGKRWLLLPGVQSNTVHGLVGVELKF